MSEGMKRIEAERKRQLDEEGFDASHDDEQHSWGDLSDAAWCYERAESKDAPIPMDWPWEERWWKPKDRIRNLERAGALYMAEADKARRKAERVAKLLDEALTL